MKFGFLHRDLLVEREGLVYCPFVAIVVVVSYFWTKKENDLDNGWT
jgi:hypothetical protein